MMQESSILEPEKAKEEKFIRLFRGLYKKAQNGELTFKTEEKKRKDYFYVAQEVGGKSFFVGIVPQERIDEFRAQNKQNPNAILGFSVLVKAKTGEEVRVGCFGVSNAQLLKSLANTTKRSWSYRFMKKRMKSQKRGYGI